MGTIGLGAIKAASTPKALSAAKRQRRSVEFKFQVVEENLATRASVARVARVHCVNAKQVVTWRRLYRQGRLGRVHRAMPALLAVQVTESAVPPRVTETNRMSCGSSAERAGTIQIELPKGPLRLSGSVDPETLRVVLEPLGG